MNIDFKYYLAVFWRRLPYFVILTALFTSIGVSLAVVLPSQYRSTATLLMEGAQIPTRLASSTVETNSSEQLQIIEQRLLTRDNLLDIADRLNVYRDVEDPMNASEIVDDMRSRTTLRSESGRDSATIMRISFMAGNPGISAAVANEFVTLVLQENVQMRTNRAGETLEFFEQEVDRLGVELDTQSTRILQFQNENAESLPGSEDFLRDERSQASDRLASIEREEALLRDQRARLVEIFERTGQAVAEADQLTPDQQALATARAELEEALLIYSAQNPRIRFLESRVALLEDRASRAPAEEPTEARVDEVSAIQPQLDEIDTALRRLSEERSEVQENLEAVTARLSDLPANRITLAKLERDYDNLRTQYNEAISRLSAAETGERIELLAKGERISVVEQAVPSERPESPNRPLIAAGGAGAGILAGLALIMLLELLNRSIRRPVELTDRLGITPLGVVPYIRTEREVVAKRMTLVGILLALLILIPAVLFYVHSQLMPLDPLLERIANKIGISINFD